MKNWIPGLALLLLQVSTPYSYAAGAAAHGNQLNAAQQPPALVPDPAGLNIFQKNLRTPTGLLYQDVLKWPKLKPLGDGGWQYYLNAEAGYLASAGDDGPATFTEYGDWSDGFILNRFSTLAENPETAQFLKINGGGIGRDDQYLQFAAGRYGKYDLNITYDTTPHDFSNSARVLWDGKGTDNLTLPAPLVPGASTLNGVLAAFLDTGYSSLALERDKLSTTFNFRPNRQLRLYAGGSTEWRDGLRPFGGGFTYPGLGQVMETVEPIDYTTHEVSVGLTYTGDTYQANLAYAGSFFRNHYPTLTWENPGLTPFVTFAPEQGRFALTPDNENHNLRGDFATSLPFWRSRLTTTFAYNQSVQDELLIPPTISAGIIGSPPNAINLDAWNTPAALSTDRADAEIESLDLHAKLTMNPRRDVRLAGELRYRDQDNHTDYTAYNPVTGEYGYIALDGGPGVFGPPFSGIYVPTAPGDRVRFRSIPFDKDSLFLSAGVDYNLAGNTDLSAFYEHEAMDYGYREVEEVTDNRFQIRVTHRYADLGTLRLSYEYADRDGGNYNANPYEPFYTSSLPGFINQFPDGNRPHTLSAMRKYDIADKYAHTVNAKLNIMLNEEMDLMLSGSYVDNDYAADYGLDYSDSVTANIEWNYQFALNASVYAFYSYQEDGRRLANIKDANPVAANPDPGGPVYPLNRAWSEEITDTNHSLGAGLNFSRGALTLDLGYTYLYANSRFRYDYASPAAFLNQFTPAEVGDGFPDQDFRYHLLEGNLRWAIRDNTNLKLLYRYEQEDLDDFHYTGLNQPVIANNIFLLAVPVDYAAHVFAIMVEHSF